MDNTIGNEALPELVEREPKPSLMDRSIPGGIVRWTLTALITAGASGAGVIPFAAIVGMPTGVDILAAKLPAWYAPWIGLHIALGLVTLASWIGWQFYRTCTSPRRTKSRADDLPDSYLDYDYPDDWEGAPENVGRSMHS